MTGRPTRVDVVWTRLDPGIDPSAAVLALLTPTERERAAKLPSRRRMREFVRTRSFVRRVLGSRLGCAPERVPLLAEIDGPPRIGGGPFVSIAHAAGVAALALADDAAVGIDIEPGGDEMTEHDGARSAVLLRSIRHRSLDRLAPRHRWMCAEALVKLEGRGWRPFMPSEGRHTLMTHHGSESRCRPAIAVGSVRFQDLHGWPGTAGVLATRGHARVTERIELDA